MDSESLNALILQLLCEVLNNDMVLVPAQASLGSYRHIDCIHHAAGNLKHERHILQQSCSGSLGSYTLHRAAEIDIQNIGTRRFNHDASGFFHCIGIFAINLNRHGTLFGTNLKFLNRAVDIAHQSVA